LEYDITSLEYDIKDRNSSSGPTPRIGAKRQIGSRNLWENAKRQVWNTILKREAAAVGLIHVCFADSMPRVLASDDPRTSLSFQLIHSEYCTQLQYSE
jgi:hypothetical protein